MNEAELAYWGGSAEVAKWPKQKRVGTLAISADIVGSLGVAAAQTMLSMATKLAGSSCRTGAAP